MRKSLKSGVSLLLCLVLAFTIAPTCVFAAEPENFCGQNVTWILGEDGLLTISGSGKMYDYDFISYAANLSPWYENRDNISRVVIEEGVTNIGSGAFYNCNNLEYVEIPSSVTELGEYAFSWCVNLKSVVIPDGVRTIPTGAFSCCYGVESISMPDRVTKICDWAFSYCEALTDIRLSNNLNSIGKAAFWNCVSLKEICITNNVSKIQDRTFFNCSSLEHVELPKRMRKIGNSAFENCYELKTIDLPNGVSEIGRRAFANCYGLTAFDLPDVVIHIADSAFAGCSGLEKVKFSGKVKSVGENAFGATVLAGCESLSEVYYEREFPYWSRITIKNSNESLDTVMMHYATSRIWNDDNMAFAYETADYLLDLQGNEQFEAIVIVDKDDFALTQAAAYLAAKKSAPILFSDSTSTIKTLRKYIKKNLKEKGTIYLIGDEATVSPTHKYNFKVERISGETVFDTNINIINTAKVEKTEEYVLVCGVRDKAMLLAASATNCPVVFVDKTLSDAQKKFFSGLSDKQIYIVGGTSFVSEAIESELGAYGEVERINGSTRNHTSVKLAETVLENPECAVLMTLSESNSNMAVSSIANIFNAPIIYVTNGEITNISAAEYLAENEIFSGVVIGEKNSVSDSTVEKLFAMDWDQHILER